MVKLQTGSENFSNGFTDQSEQSFIMQNWDWFDMNPLLTFSFPFKEAYVHIRYFTYHLYGKPHAKLVQMGQESSTWRCVDSNISKSRHFETFQEYCLEHYWEFCLNQLTCTFLTEVRWRLLMIFHASVILSCECIVFVKRCGECFVKHRKDVFSHWSFAKG